MMYFIYLYICVYISIKIRMQEEYHEFIIIGAGIAGLEAALVLAENKKDFIVLEASDKIGGRIAT